MINIDTKQIITPISDLKRSPDPKSELETQCLLGEDVVLLDKKKNWLYCKTKLDNYSGWLNENDVGKRIKITHKTSSNITHLYSEPNIKSNLLDHLYFNSKISIEKLSKDWSKIKIREKTGYINMNHIKKINFLDKDWIKRAVTFLGAPYLWGGKSYLGIDCSALVQIVLENAGIYLPRNTQEQIDFETDYFFNIKKIEKSCLIYWEGHVAIAINEKQLIHSNAYHMSVKIEPIEIAVNRIKNLYGKVICIKKIII